MQFFRGLERPLINISYTVDCMLFTEVDNSRWDNLSRVSVDKVVSYL